jgi:hypothetical protein
MSAMKSSAAIHRALDAYRKPVLARALRRADVPPGMLSLIKIAAGAEDEIAEWVSQDIGEAALLKDAASFYLQQLLTQADGDSHRQLGLRPDATPQDVKDHKRWLLKWLHPDRNGNQWEHVLFHRVTSAAERLEAAMREGRAALHRPAVRRRRAPRAGWQVARTRMKLMADWRPRAKKALIAAAVFVVIVGAAQAVLLRHDDAGLMASMMSFTVQE